MVKHDQMKLSAASRNGLGNLSVDSGAGVLGAWAEVVRAEDVGAIRAQ
jgi:hypothetical protein